MSGRAARAYREALAKAADARTLDACSARFRDGAEAGDRPLPSKAEPEKKGSSSTIALSAPPARRRLVPITCRKRDRFQLTVDIRQILVSKVLSR